MYLTQNGTYKNVGSVQTLADKMPEALESTTGIAHTRWATHGEPSLKNTHPHTDQSGRIWVVHNGMIENFHELRDGLISKGHIFKSDTDTEVLAHLIGKEYKAGKKPHDAVASALTKIIGTCGLAVIFDDEPDCIIIASMGNAMSIGIKDGEYIISSDMAPMLRHTSNVVTLQDGEYAVVRPDAYAIYTFKHELLSRTPEVLNVALERAQRKEKPHHMMKDILEIPSVLENSARGRILIGEGTAKFGGLENFRDIIKNISRLIIVGCGSSYFAGTVGKLLFEDYIGVPVKVEYGSEFAQRPFTFHDDQTILIAISQSGETPEILESVRAAKKAGINTFGVVNVVGSTIAKMVDTGVYNHAGPEYGVRSTKTYVSQLEILTLLALYVSRIRGLSQARGAELALEIQRLPDKARSILSNRGAIKQIAERYLGYDDFLFMGRGYNVASAYEGALKFKKVSYVHAEGFPAGEVKHGPIAMLNDIFPTVAIAPHDSSYNSILTDINFVRERKGPVIAIATEGDTEIAENVDDVIYIPDTKECLTPILANLPLQLLAYYTGALRGFNTEPPLRPTNVMFNQPQ
jgi:glucosamine--fructose-6-phosphate aminotransferase (isomerizing)